MCSKRYGIEIHDFSRIGKGIKLSHAFAITVNSGVTIGENCTLFKGCTIGSIRGGEKAGVPVIGDRVVVGTNSTVVGNITIGSDVIVVSNTFVNFDVPSNSIVIGSKAIIKSKMNSTVMYL